MAVVCTPVCDSLNFRAFVCLSNSVSVGLMSFIIIYLLLCAYSRHHLVRAISISGLLHDMFLSQTEHAPPIVLVDTCPHYPSFLLSCSSSSSQQNEKKRKRKRETRRIEETLNLLVRHWVYPARYPYRGCLPFLIVLFRRTATLREMSGLIGRPKNGRCAFATEWVTLSR